MATAYADDGGTTAVGNESLDRIRKASLGGRVRVLVQHDTLDSCSRWEIGKQAVPTSLENVDSGDPNTLYDFMRWGMQAAPADHYAVVIWSHGSGWMPSTRVGDLDATPLAVDRGADLGPGPFFTSTLRAIVTQASNDRAIASDDSFRHALDTIELGEVMGRVAAERGGPIDMLVMNACQMASAEVAYQLRAHVGVYVASPVNMPVYGLPYDDILTQLGAAPDMDAAALGKLLVERYCAVLGGLAELQGEWGVGKMPPGATLTAVRAARLEAVASTVTALSAALRADLDSQFDALWDAVRTMPNYTEFQLCDLAYFCRLLLAQPGLADPSRAAAQRVIDALSDPELCIARGYTSDVFKEHGGLTTYLRPLGQDKFPIVSSKYGETDYGKTTSWGDVLLAWQKLA
jgi:hypothetical protein